MNELPPELRGRRLLVAAGPTHEPLDDVRYLGNRSSGKLGIAVAEAGRDAGCHVDLVLGPSCLEAPVGVATARVETALEMQAALAARFERCDALVMAAAVADYRPARRVPGKLKKVAGEEGLTLELVRNPDLLAGMSARRRPGQVLVGFALEAQDALANAKAKLLSKGVDLLVLDAPATLGAESSDFTLLRPDGAIEEFFALPKPAFARVLLTRLAALLPR